MMMHEEDVNNDDDEATGVEINDDATDVVMVTVANKWFL
jgi:hypothetical protein